MFNQIYMEFIFFLIGVIIIRTTAYPPALAMKPKPSTICNYCLCDEHSSTVICTSAHILLKTVNLPSWTESFYAHNLSMLHFPHFNYHPGLKVLRINHCQLSEIHPLALIPLPNLETVHFADNHLDSIPETLFRRLRGLRILNLARNRMENFDSLEWAFPEGLVLDQLILDGNPFKLGPTKQISWPIARQLHMANANIERLYGEEIIFRKSTLCPDPNTTECRTLKLHPEIWPNLKVLDISNNMNMSLDPSVLQKLANATNLKLNNVKLPENFVEWLSSNGVLRHLELRQSSAIRAWKTCAPNLEWLDISETGLESLEVGEKCKLRWLYATDNRIKLLKLSAKPLKIIYLDRNQLERWPFENESNSRQFPNLEELSIKQNRIETLPARALYRFPLLENLDLSENLIERIEPDAFPTVGMALQYLNMSGNRLKDFGHPILPSLIILDISKNLLHGMDRQLLAGLPSLQHLHLSNNFNILNGCEHGDCWVEESGLENLIEIDLSGCQIKKQPNLANFVNLRAINLGGNLMGEVDGRRLPPCVAHLNLRWNRIHTMDNFTDIQMTCLKDLDLGHNPLKCDCSLLEFSEILALQPDLTDQNTYYCFTELLHPLNTYFEITSSCDAEESTSILVVLLNILTVLLTIAAVGCLILLFFVRVTRIVNFGSAQFFYRRVPTEIPTAL